MAAAATLPHVTVEEYLHSVYQPDCDFVDGVLETRNMGEFDHGDLQGELIALLRNHAAEWQVRAVPETRVQVAPGRFRVPDVCVMPLEWKRTQIIDAPPLLCLEVLSPEDRMSRVLGSCREFLAMGVREVWIFDPAERVALRLTGAAMTEHHEGMLRLEGTPIAIDVRAVFSVLDR